MTTESLDYLLIQGFFLGPECQQPPSRDLNGSGYDKTKEEQRGAGGEER